MPVKSEYVQAMEAVVASTAPVMKKGAFRKRRHAFNRTRENGVVAVLNFQMGSSEPPGSYEIAGLKDNLYGKFTVDLGIGSAVPWLERFDTRRALLTAWERHERISRDVRLALVIAMIYQHEGQAENAQRTFIEYYRSPHNPHHLEWLRRLAPQIGIASLTDVADREE